jgi:hypothetical protein
LRSAKRVHTGRVYFFAARSRLSVINKSANLLYLKPVGQYTALENQKPEIPCLRNPFYLNYNPESAIHYPGTAFCPG